MSDDDVLTGTGEPVAPPAEHRPIPSHELPDQPSHSERIKERFQMGLGLAAHGTEDATDFVKERQVQQKYLDGEDIGGTEIEDWHRRTRASLQRAVDNAARARGEVPPSEQQAPAQPANYVPMDDPSYEEHQRAAGQRFQQFYRERGITDVPAYIQACSDIVAEAGAENLVGYIAKSEVAPQMMEWLVYQPDKMRTIAHMPLAEQAHAMAALEGYAYAQRERELQDRNAQYPEQPQPRTISRAPPPITPPKGAANPPRDLHSLATKDNATDYIKARQEQERRYKEKWE